MITTTKGLIGEAQQSYTDENWERWYLRVKTAMTTKENEDVRDSAAKSTQLHLNPTTPRCFFICCFRSLQCFFDSLPGSDNPNSHPSWIALVSLWLFMHSIKRSKKLEISLQVRELDKVTDLSMLTLAFLMTLRKYNSIFFCLINGSRPCTRIRNQSHKSHHKICITTYCALVRIRNFVHLKIQERSQTSQIRPSAARI
jgi:hypothetical protein